MKPFKKDEHGNYICEECGKICLDKTVLSIHNIKIHNLNPNQYFDKHIKEEGEGICKICGNPTKLIRSDRGYKDACCKKCQDIYTYQKTCEALFKKFGVTNQFQREDIKQLCKKIKKEKYNNEKFTNPLKAKATILRKYGVSNIMHIDEFFNKQQKSSFQTKQYKNTKIWYQASYEKDFLDNYYEKFKNEIKRGPSIKYLFENQVHYYRPDFYIPSLNLIIEIKSSYWDRVHKKKIEYKESATKEKYNYIKIINKDYDEFNRIINKVKS